MKKLITFLVTTFFMFVVTKAYSQWEQTAFNTNYNIRDIVVVDSNVYAAYLQNGVHYSSNNGTNAYEINNGIPGLKHTICLKIKDSNIYVGNIIYGIYKTTNNGNYWFSINDSSTQTRCVNDIEKYNHTIIMGTHGGVYRSTNEGQNWANINNNLPLIYVSTVFHHNNNIAFLWD